jgi:hypothetical protein
MHFMEPLIQLLPNTPLIGKAGALWLRTGGLCCLPVALLVLILALDQGWISRILSAPLGVLLGELSFSVYLFHGIVIKFLKINTLGWPELPEWLVYAYFWVLLLAISHVVWWGWEKPLRRLILGRGFRFAWMGIGPTGKPATSVRSFSQNLFSPGPRLVAGETILLFILAVPIFLFAPTSENLPGGSLLGEFKDRHGTKIGKVFHGRALTDWLDDLGSPLEETRYQAALALGDIDDEFHTVSSRLVVCLRDRDERVRRETARAFAKIAPRDAAVVAELIHALQDPDTDVRQNAATALGRTQVAKEDAVTALEKTREDPQAGMRLAVVGSLGKLVREDSRVVHWLGTALSDADPAVRLEAANSLLELGKDAKAVLPALQQALNDPSADVRDVVIKTMEAIRAN